MNWRDNSMAWPHLRSRKALNLALALCVLALGISPGEAKSKARKTATPTPAPADGKKDFDVPIPINHDAKGVRIPIYSPEGVLQMMFESEIAFRMDAQQLRLTQLKIETYDGGGKPEMVIEMPNSVFDLKTRVFSSVDPVTIRRTDFEVTGANMTFDTETRMGKFTGPVRMLIFKPDTQEVPPLSQ
ncbi:MAG: hypothetical protein NTZ46_04680 [Verrucomicrobia bacterium]|nr:hypothetical protein [Verrucomicrobiota bacterium]